MTRFVLNGVSMVLDVDETVRRLHGVLPEVVRQHGVRVGGIVYPVKQAFEIASGVPRAAYTSQTARRHLKRLGFEIINDAGPPRNGPPDKIDATTSLLMVGVHDPRGWPWEGHVQALFTGYLREHGWVIRAVADTATKARGVDVLAQKDSRRLGAEVKGWPSDGYADPHRQGEAKATTPSTQAGHWFSQALCKAIMLLDSHPGYDSLVVLPDYPRYRDLADRTRTGRKTAGLHVVLVDEDGAVTCDTWSP
jgi:hypothetical protein